MGIDVEVFFKTKGLCSWDNAKTILGDVKLNDDREFREPSHHISSLVRLYDVDYARGPWPSICSILMELLADTEVEKVWYGGDCIEAKHLPEMTGDRLLELTKFYLENENRTYTSRF